MCKPYWLTIAEHLVVQAQRDINKAAAKSRREAAARALYALEERARLSLYQKQQKGAVRPSSSLQGAVS